MSISTLFAPNPYNLYCNTITPAVGIPVVSTNNIDAVNVGDTLSIAAVKAGAVTFGHAGIFVNMAGPLNTPLLGVDTIQARTSVVMNIGANAAGLNLIPALGNVSLDNAAPSADVLALGTLNIGSIDMGRVNGAIAIGKTGGSITIGCPLILPGGGAIVSRSDMVPISSSAQGCFVVPVPNFVLFEGYKENGVVFLRWRFIGSTTNSTATSTCVMSTVIPVGFRPLSTLLVACSVIGLSGNFYPGQYTIQANGVHGFQFINSTHSGTTTWNSAIPEPCAVEEGSIMFTAA